jgi:hypothetical protein
MFREFCTGLGAQSIRKSFHNAALRNVRAPGVPHPRAKLSILHAGGAGSVGKPRRLRRSARAILDAITRAVANFIPLATGTRDQTCRHFTSQTRKSAEQLQLRKIPLPYFCASSFWAKWIRNSPRTFFRMRAPVALFDRLRTSRRSRRSAVRQKLMADGCWFGLSKSERWGYRVRPTIAYICTHVESGIERRLNALQWVRALEEANGEAIRPESTIHPRGRLRKKSNVPYSLPLPRRTVTWIRTGASTWRTSIWHLHS